jgi:hypothetical protein
MRQLTWDYKEFKKQEPMVFCSQKDWNQTLMTKINQMAAQINKTTYMGGPNKIKINKKLFSLLSDLDYFRVNENGDFTLSGRFHIIIDNSILDDTILIYHETENVLKAKEDNKMFCIENVKNENDIFYEIKFSLVEINSTEYNNALNNPNIKVLTDEMLSGEIKILNYGLCM